MALCSTCVKPLSEPIIIQFTDAYMHQWFNYLHCEAYILIFIYLCLNYSNNDEWPVPVGEWPHYTAHMTFNTFYCEDYASCRQWKYPGGAIGPNKESAIQNGYNCHVNKLLQFIYDWLCRQVNPKVLWLDRYLCIRNLPRFVIFTQVRDGVLCDRFGSYNITKLIGRYCGCMVFT